MSEHVAKSEVSFVSKSHYDPVNYVTMICAIMVHLLKTGTRNFSELMLEENNFMGKIRYEIWPFKYNPVINANIRDSETKKV